MTGASCERAAARSASNRPAAQGRLFLGRLGAAQLLLACPGKLFTKPAGDSQPNDIPSIASSMPSDLLIVPLIGVLLTSGNVEYVDRQEF
jgi:hypothetical protein